MTFTALRERPYWDSVENRLTAWSRRDGATGCLLWTGRITYAGYGHIGIRNKHDNAHRVAYKVWIGPIPDGLEIDHLCNVRNCIEPTHLEAVTHAENLRRAAARRTHCVHGHDLAEHGYISVRGHRRCRECKSIARRAYRAKVRANRAVA